MDAVSYSHSAKQAQRIEKFIKDPDSSSGIVTVPKVIGAGESVTVPAGRVAVLPNVQVDGTLNVEGEVFIPSGATLDGVVEKVVSTDNALVRFNGTTGDVQNSGVIVDDAGNVGIGTSNPNHKIHMVGRPSSHAVLRIEAGGQTTTDAVLDLTARGSDGTFNNAEIRALGSTAYGTTLGFYTDNTDGNITKQMTLDANASLILGSASMSGTRAVTVQSGTLANDEKVTLSAFGGTSGVLNRVSTIGTIKHSGITNACSYFTMTSQDGGANSIWVDDVDQLRISPALGNVGTTNGTIVGTQTSDERVKNIVGTCPYGLQEILELETYKYSMKDDIECSYKLGFVAQQAMGVIPESVYDTNERLTEAVTVTKQKVVKEAVKDEEGNILEPEVAEPYEDIEYQETEDTVTKLAMDYQMMIPVLVNAMKEQQELINSLKARLDILEGAV